MSFNMYANLRQASDLPQDDMLDLAYSRWIWGSKKQTYHYGQAENEINLSR